MVETEEIVEHLDAFIRYESRWGPAPVAAEEAKAFIIKLDAENAKLRAALIGALRETHGVGIGGVYRSPVLSDSWHQRYSEIIEAIAIFKDDMCGRTVIARTALAPAPE